MVPNFAHPAPDAGDKCKCKRLNVVAEKVWSSHTLKTESKFPQVLLESEPIPDLELHRQTLACFSCFLFFRFDSNSSMKVGLVRGVILPWPSKKMIF